MIDGHELPARSRRQGSFDLAIPAAEAFGLFTTEGSGAGSPAGIRPS